MNYENELKKIDDFIEKIGEIAESDGQISNDEREILDAIFNELSDYRALVLDVIEDGEITEDEKLQMKEFRENILNKANETAIKDGVYSDEERSIIDSIIDFVGED